VTFYTNAFWVHILRANCPTVTYKNGPQHRKGIYISYESPSIIHFLEPLTSDHFTARFADNHFDKTVFPSLGGAKNVNVPEE